MGAVWLSSLPDSGFFIVKRTFRSAPVKTAFAAYPRPLTGLRYSTVHPDRLAALHGSVLPITGSWKMWLPGQKRGLQTDIVRINMDYTKFPENLLPVHK